MSDEEVLHQLPAASQQESATIKILRQALQQAPENSDIASQLATAYINKARIDSDSRYYGYAEAVLKPWWKLQPPPNEVLFLRATLQQHQHAYQPAIADLKQLVSHQPRNAQAWLSLATIQQVTGDYVAARAGCSALARTASHWFASVCHSQVFSLTGNAERAYALQHALAAQISSRQPELQQWVLGLSAETAWRLDRKKQAEQQFKAALALPLRDAYLLRVYSDFLLAEKRPNEVLALLQNEMHDDALLLRLTLAAHDANKQALTKKYQSLLASRYREAALRASNLHERDEAVYLLAFSLDAQDTKKALKLARANWAIQHEPDDVLLLLKAAIANQSLVDIQTVRHWMAEQKLQDIRIEALLATQQVPQEKIGSDDNA
jgi:tetratricopeptide (TPR) repeat protein